MKQLTPNEIIRLSEDLQGTCMSVDDALIRIGLDPDKYDNAEVVSQLVDVELCDVCGWWDESSQMEDCVCEDCRGA